MAIKLDGTAGITSVDGSATVPSHKGSTGGNTAGIFYPAANSIAFTTSGAEAMRIDTSGNIGIGTSSPGYKLEIATSTLIGSRLYPVSGTNGATYVLSNNGGNFYYGIDSSTGANFGAAYAGVLSHSGAYPILFATSSTERMRIDASGNLLVGGTTKYGKITSTNSSFDPTASSNIGNAAITAQGNYGGGISIIDSGTQGYTMWSQTAGADFYIRRATTSGAYTGGVYISNAAGSWSAASDERLKNIISPIENAVEKLSSLRCVIGEYKENIGNYHPFLLAQDVQAVFPEVVNEFDKDNGYLGMSYTDMVPILVKAIQELSAKNDALEARLAALEVK